MATETGKLVAFRGGGRPLPRGWTQARPPRGRIPSVQGPNPPRVRERVRRSERGDEQVKAYHEELWFEVPARMDFVNITPRVEAAVSKSGVQDGLCLVNAMHITASVFINDDEPGLHRDYKRWLEELAPQDPSRYDHNNTGEDNGDAHHKRQIMGREVVVAITDGELHLGQWEHIFYYEFDGRRKKRILVKIIGE